MGGILWRLGLVSRKRFLEMQRLRDAWRLWAARQLALARLQESQADLEMAEEDVAELNRDLEDCKRSLEKSVMIIEEKDIVIQELNGRIADLERDVRERDALIRGIRQLAESAPKRRGRDKDPAW